MQEEEEISIKRKNENFHSNSFVRKDLYCE